MKLLLASNGKFLIKEGYKSLGIAKNDIKIGYITTASKGVEDKSYIERHRKEMAEEGYFFEEFDIEGKTKEEILKFFKNKNIIHVEGGNTFYLLKVVRDTKFDVILRQLLEGGKIYVGASAGAYIMTPTVEVSTWKPVMHNRSGLEDLTALSYVPFLIKVHYIDEQKEQIKEKIKTLKYPLRILRDGQGFLCEDGVCKFVGEGKEVKLE